MCIRATLDTGVEFYIILKLSFAKNPARDKWGRNIELLTAQFAELRHGGRRRQTQESARAPERHNAEPAGRAQRLAQETTGVQRSSPPLIKCPEAVSRGEQLSIQSSLQFAHILNSIYPMASATIT